MNCIVSRLLPAALLQFGQTLVYITPNQGIAQVVAGGLNFLW
jgi:hypothetical protein